MTKGTLFGNIHSSRDLGLILQKVEVQPAAPKTNYIDIPGGDGSKDMTEALGVGVKYTDREITWTFALYPGADWYDKQREVSGVLNGLACQITLDDDVEYYYDGRLTVANHASDKLLRQITVKAVCRPYKRRQLETVIAQSISTDYTVIALSNERMPVVPTITVSRSTTLRFNGSTYSINAGTHKLLNIRLTAGTHVLEAKTTSSTGTISIRYREGAL